MARLHNVHIIKDGEPYYGQVWEKIEEPILRENLWNGKVTDISEVIIDAK